MDDELKTMKGLKELLTDDADFENAIMLLRSSKETLKIENSTRWTSLYSMLESFKRQQSSMFLALGKLHKFDLILSEKEFSIIDDLLKILSIFKEATTALQSKTKATLHLVIFFHDKIKNSLQNIQQVKNDELKFCVMPLIEQSLKSRMSIHFIHLAAAVLHPSLKDVTYSLTSLSLNEKMDILMKTFTLFGLKNTQASGPSSSGDDEEGEEDPIDAEILSVHRQIIGKGATNVNISLEEEFKSYIILKLDSKPQLFWPKEKNRFPNLFKLANAVYGVPATSASSESNFSVTGIIDNQKAMHSGSSLITKRVFCSANYNILKKVHAISTRNIIKKKSKLAEAEIPAKKNKPEVSSKLSLFAYFLNMFYIFNKNFKHNIKK